MFTFSYSSNVYLTYVSILRVVGKLTPMCLPLVFSFAHCHQLCHGRVPFYCCRKGSWSFWTWRCTNAGNFYIYSIRLENGKWVVYYSYYLLKVCVNTVPCFTMWCSAVAQGLREAMYLPFVATCVCIHRSVCCVQDSYRDHFGDPSENFSSGIRSVSLCLSLPFLCCVCDPQLLLSTIPLSPSFQTFPFPAVSILSFLGLRDLSQPSIQCHLQYPVTPWMMVVNAFCLLHS